MRLPIHGRVRGRMWSERFRLRRETGCNILQHFATWTGVTPGETNRIQSVATSARRETPTTWMERLELALFAGLGAFWRRMAGFVILTPLRGSFHFFRFTHGSAFGSTVGYFLAAPSGLGFVGFSGLCRVWGSFGRHGCRPCRLGGPRKLRW